MSYNKRLQSISPFISLGVSIVLLVGLFILLFNIIFWGFIVGAVLWLGFYIKLRFFGGKMPPFPPQQRKQADEENREEHKHKGVTIDHNDL